MWPVKIPRLIVGLLLSVIFLIFPVGLAQCKEIVFLIDDSGTMSPYGWIKSAISDFIINSTKDTEIAVIAFSGTQKVEPLRDKTYWTEEFQKGDRLSLFLDEIKFEGSKTHFHPALKRALRMLRDSERQKCIILISDGIPDWEGRSKNTWQMVGNDFLDMRKTMSQSQRNNVNIYALWLSRRVDISFFSPNELIARLKKHIENFTRIEDRELATQIAGSFLHSLGTLTGGDSYSAETEESAYDKIVKIGKHLDCIELIVPPPSVKKNIKTGFVVCNRDSEYYNSFEHNIFPLFHEVEREISFQRKELSYYLDDRIPDYQIPDLSQYNYDYCVLIYYDERLSEPFKFDYKILSKITQGNKEAGMVNTNDLSQIGTLFRRDFDEKWQRLIEKDFRPTPRKVKFKIYESKKDNFPIGGIKVELLSPAVSGFKTQDISDSDGNAVIDLPHGAPFEVIFTTTGEFEYAKASCDERQRQYFWEGNTWKRQIPIGKGTTQNITVEINSEAYIDVVFQTIQADVDRKTESPVSAEMTLYLMGSNRRYISFTTDSDGSFPVSAFLNGIYIVTGKLLSHDSKLYSLTKIRMGITSPGEFNLTFKKSRAKEIGSVYDNDPDGAFPEIITFLSGSAYYTDPDTLYLVDNFSRLFEEGDDYVKALILWRALILTEFNYPIKINEKERRKTYIPYDKLKAYLHVLAIEESKHPDLSQFNDTYPSLTTDFSVRIREEIRRLRNDKEKWDKIMEYLQKDRQIKHLFKRFVAKLMGGH